MKIQISLEADEIRMAVIGPQCACAISEDNGHKEQAQMFR